MIKRVTHGGSLQSRALDRGLSSVLCGLGLLMETLREMKKQNLRKGSNTLVHRTPPENARTQASCQRQFPLTSVFTRAKLRDSVWIARSRGCGVNFSPGMANNPAPPSPH